MGDFFSRRRVPAFVVGGAIRDRLLGRESGDIDIVVGGPGLELARGVAALVGGYYVPMDEVNGVARVVLPQTTPELHLDISTMRGGIEEDLAGRDFTVDAMAVDLVKGTFASRNIIDPYGGQRDLVSRSVRALSEVNLQSDPLRLLRAVRLGAELGFEIEPDTAILVRRNAHLAATVSAERVRDEIYRTIAAPDAFRWLSCLDELGLLTTIIPEMEAGRGEAQPTEHYWDVFRHSLETVAALEFLIGGRPPQNTSHLTPKLLAAMPRTSSLEGHFSQEMSSGRQRGGLLRLVGLLHDVAKPKCKTIEQNGRIRFLGHAHEGARMAVDIMERLRFSAREVETASTAIENHLRPGTWGEELPTDRAVYRFFRDTGDAGIDVIFLNLADHLASRGPALTLPEWQRHAQAASYVLTKYFQEKAVVAPPKLLDGHLVMERLRLSPGPLIGEILEAVREAQAAGEVGTREEALALAARLSARGVAAAEVASSRTA